jgi:3D (Asp-Asp-Asp) domain-containing protein
MKGRRTGYLGVFSGGKIFVVIVLFAIITPVVSRVVGAVLAQAGGRLTLLSATTTGVETVSPSVVKESVMKTAPQQTNQWETVRMRVTAYCACRRCCGKFADGITASGHKIRRGDTFAAADKKYSFGTEMIVAGYNNGKPIKVLDRGGAIRGNKLDVFFNSHRTARKWGVKYGALNILTSRYAGVPKRCKMRSGLPGNVERKPTLIQPRTTAFHSYICTGGCIRSFSYTTLAVIRILL